MTACIGRREFITLLGGAAAAWPLAARAQQPAMPVVGFLHGGSPEPNVNPVAAFRKGLAEAGYVEGQNVAIEYRWAESEYGRLPALAAELVGRQVTVLAAAGGTQAAVVAKAATTAIPIVFSIGADPIAAGLVTSLNRPGGNVTGVYFLTTQLEGKRLGLLRELVPIGALIAVLLNPTIALAEAHLKDVQVAAHAAGQRIHILHASNEPELDTAFAAVAKVPAAALLVGADPFFLVGRILKGANPADLPVQQVTKFEFVINLRTAKALGVSISDNLLSLADASSRCSAVQPRGRSRRARGASTMLDITLAVKLARFFLRGLQ